MENFLKDFLCMFCSFEDLKAGLTNLKRKDGQRSEGPREFFKINLTTLLDCFDTMTGEGMSVACRLKTSI